MHQFPFIGYVLVCKYGKNSMFAKEKKEFPFERHPADLPFGQLKYFFIDIVTWNSKNFGTLKPNANIVTSKMYMAGWHLLILIHSGLQTAK